MSGLELTLLYLLAAVLGVVVSRSLKLPPMLGYLVVGVVIGPNALALGNNADGVRHLGEFGVVFLMFVIGLEFNLSKLRAMRRHVFGLGLFQVVLTILLATVGSLFLSVLAPTLWNMSWQTALTLSGALAMSSTAIVVKLMAERLELESEHGKRVMGVLLFQDLAVVPLLVLIPALGSPPEELLRALGFAALKAAALIAVLLVGGQRVMRWWLTIVARRKSEELFVLNLLLVTLGLAYLTELAGLSLALGAFIAGMLISETEFKHQVETDIRPFHDVLLGLFFISIGMLLDWRLVAERWGLVLLLVTVPVLFKLVLVTVPARMLGASMGVSLRTGLYLAQAGEFGFVLLTLGQQHDLVSPSLLNPILASMVLSMVASPFIIMYSNRIVLKLVAGEWLQQSLQMTSIARKSINTSKHVIICGYGRCGQNLARMLEREGIPYLALDLDPDRVRQAAAAGDSVVFGDAARLQSLMAAGLARASAVVVSYQDTPSALRILQIVREHAPTVPVGFKLLLVALLAKMFKASTGVSRRTGLYLAQAGEFGFVLLALAQQQELVPAALLNPILASMVLSMLITPFLIQWSNRIVMKLVANEWMLQSLQMTTIARRSINANKHVII
ncbi:MAG: potassium transporter, partial [Ramlibacter sp.]|nr:potassium transporter [Ramlibacter sp.]